MKKLVVAFAFLALTMPAATLFAQTITVNIADTVTAGGRDSITIDINNDSVADVEVKIYGLFDAVFISDLPLHNNLWLSSPKVAGEVFGNHQQLSFIAQTAIGCSWVTQGWLPGTGIRYVGYYWVNAPADTTFGWIKMDFRESATPCQDSVIIFESAYHPVSNVHLKAGEKLTSTAVEDVHAAFNVNVYPNPAGEKLFIQLHSTAPATLFIYNQMGAKIATVIAATGNTELSVDHLSPGIYLLETSTSATTIRQKFVKR